MAATFKKDHREGHRQRLRQKFLDNGLNQLTDAEVLELLLSFGTPRRDCKETARSMLKKFGTIRQVFEASKEELAQIPGAGSSNIVAIKFIHAVSGKFLKQRLTGRSYLQSSREIFEYLRFEMENLEKEVFKIIFLDDSNAILGIENVSEGTVNEALANPREIIKRSLETNATGLILVHNHPSGNVQPSTGDMRFTRRLVHLAYMTGMLVCDHLIIGKNGEFFSFSDNGLILIYNQEVRATYSGPPLRDGGGLRHEQSELGYTQIKLRPKKAKKPKNGDSPPAIPSSPQNEPAGGYIHSSRPGASSVAGETEAQKGPVVVKKSGQGDGA